MIALIVFIGVLLNLTFALQVSPVHDNAPTVVEKINKIVDVSGTEIELDVEVFEISTFKASEQKAAPMSAVGAAGSFCPTCVAFFDDAIDILLNQILNGFKGDCAQLCGYLPQRTEAEVCELLCLVAGIETFIDLIKVADPDPIWICGEIDGICPFSDTAKGNITELTVVPAKGPQGTKFGVTAVFQILSTVGTGQFELYFKPPLGDGQPFGSVVLLVEKPPGIYGVRGTLSTQPNMNEPFNPGSFQVIGWLCEGTCGGKHAHEYTLSERATHFIITP